jgi:hypothetical protein
MATLIDRRAFLRRAGTAAAALVGAPLVITSRARAAGDRLVVAVGQWGIETPFAWRSSQSAGSEIDDLGGNQEGERLADAGVRAAGEQLRVRELAAIRK